MDDINIADEDEGEVASLINETRRTVMPMLVDTGKVVSMVTGKIAVPASTVAASQNPS